MSEAPAAFRSQSGEPERLRVLVVGPAGRGGIHRMMESLRGELASPRFANVDATFVASHTGVHLRSSLAVAHVAAVLVTRRPDVAHINLSVRGSTYRKIFISYACRILGIPYVVHLHGSNFHTFRDRSPGWLRAAADSVFIHSARILVLGQVWRDRAAEWVGETGMGRIVVLPNAVADPGPRPDRDSKEVRVLFAGRLGARKGIADLVAALGALKDAPRWHATLAGDGDVAAVAEAARAAGIADRVHIPGWVDGKRMEALMRDADILTLPSYDENLPMSVVEAFAHEVAVVCTPVGAVTDIVEDGKSGLLVEPGDVDGLAAALRRLISDNNLRQSLARNGRKVFESRLDIADYADRIVEIWRAADTERRR